MFRVFKAHSCIFAPKHVGVRWQQGCNANAGLAVWLWDHELLESGRTRTTVDMGRVSGIDPLCNRICGQHIVHP